MLSDVNAGQTPRALVTGASSGIGAAFAERLARDGYDLSVVARRRERLESLAARLHHDYGTAVEVIAADLVQPSDLLRVERRIADGPPLELLVNNAGFLDLTPFAALDPGVTEAMIRVHVVAPARLTRATLPGLIARGRGAIINVCSLAAFNAHPPIGYATYCAAKAYLATFTQGLHEELRGTGVQVQALCPGYVPTEMIALAGIDLDLTTEPGVMTAEDLVAASLAGLRLGEVTCVPLLDDLGLLSQLDALKHAINAEVPSARTSGVPAQRYIGGTLPEQ